MAALKFSIAIVGLLTIASAMGQSQQNPTLFAQSIQAALSISTNSRVRNPTALRAAWLLMDARTGQLLASQWPDADQPIPVGSLTKPFVALAYARTHAAFPRYNCEGAATRCWLPKGHGTLDFEQALAYSCNSYFLQLARDTLPASMKDVSRDYGLPAPPDTAMPDAWIGLTPTWRIAPTALARAYLRLATLPEAKSETRMIRAGMVAAAARGTARALAQEDVLAKTGTAHCIANCNGNGDGFAVALAPSKHPRLLLLVRERGTTGAMTAAFAARMLHSLRADHVISY